MHLSFKKLLLNRARGLLLIKRRALLLIALILLLPIVNVGLASSAPPAMEWDAYYGGNAGLSASQVIQTSDGGYAIAGRQGVHAIPPSVWLVKADATGKMEWNQTYEYLLNVAGLVQTSDGGYMMAGDSYTTQEGYQGITYPQGIMLVKIDAHGGVQWKKTLTGTKDGSSYMIQTSDRGYIIGGSIDKSGFLIKTDASGRVEWNRTYGEPDKNNSFSSVIQTMDGGYAAAGTAEFNDTSAFWLVKTDGNGNALWSKTYGSGDNQANSAVQTTDGGYVLAGNTRSYGEGASDAWLVKTDSHGIMLWNRTYGGAGLVTLRSGAGDVLVSSDGAGYDFAYSLIQTSDGGLAFAGKTLMPNNYALAWLVKMDAAGNVEWNQTYPNRQMGGGGWSANCLIETSDGGFALAGSWDFTDSINYYYLVKTEPALPPPTPTPTNSSSASSNFIKVIVIVMAALVVVAVFTSLICYFKKRNHAETNKDS